MCVCECVRANTLGSSDLDGNLPRKSGNLPQARTTLVSHQLQQLTSPATQALLFTPPLQYPCRRRRPRTVPSARPAHPRPDGHRHETGMTRARDGPRYTRDDHHPPRGITSHTHTHTSLTNAKHSLLLFALIHFCLLYTSRCV